MNVLQVLAVVIVGCWLVAAATFLRDARVLFRKARDECLRDLTHEQARVCFLIGVAIATLIYPALFFLGMTDGVRSGAEIGSNSDPLLDERVLENRGSARTFSIARCQTRSKRKWPIHPEKSEIGT